MRGYKEITNKYNDQYSEYVRTGRWQSVKYNANGEPYIRYKNRRILLDEFMVSSDGLAYHMETYSSGLIAEVHPDGEMVRISYTYTGRSSKAIREQEEYRRTRGW